jgi:hypothetical protein
MVVSVSIKRVRRGGTVRRLLAAPDRQVKCRRLPKYFQMLGLEVFLYL